MNVWAGWKTKMSEKKQWQGHRGQTLGAADGFDVIECDSCGFKHIIPIPSDEELSNAYQHEYYSQEKPLYVERYRKDLDWWNMVYSRRYQILEKHLSGDRRRLLDIGSGPGFFLLTGQQRGWQAKGIEPALQAVAFSRGIGIDVENGFFCEGTAKALGIFDAVNMGEVLEHIGDPAAFLLQVNHCLTDNGMVCIIVPNDFNPFQLVLRDHIGFKPWWIAPPHHINYFSFDSLSLLVNRCGFEVVYKESTFPIDMFLLMGDNYVGNDEMGRQAHTRRMNLEKALVQSGKGNLLDDMYALFADHHIGREIVLFARKRENRREADII
jgi:SAM-dependent methyltransferase